ncbi:hypothetical protein C6345_16185 [Bacillus sp. LNXM12-2]|uniref:hypothetical protein n=1 Tax=unclassified Bacillus (in: firmicutes) TaxID=185979 RepID=UPI000D07397E|nr:MULTISPECIES: hypothetical protein [unclassified Bacillus (in: firmicutes)]PSB68975.1 hypothetical protein C6Y07_17690 [Bacillus sp. LNXM12-1]PSB72879.1 hypothetical protein C6345_16185 [Bacillus sp. LNXM12-2]
MKRESRAGNSFNTLILFIYLCILIFLLSKKLYLLSSIYVVLISLWLIWVNRKPITRNINTLFVELKKLNQLKYYYITDDNKYIDLEKRQYIFNLFRDAAVGTFFISLVNIIAIRSLLEHFLGKSEIVNLFTIISISFVLIIGYGGIIAGLVYKYTTATYVLIPIINAFIYFFFLHPIINSLPYFVGFLTYLFTTVILYSALTYAFPVHILRKLNGKTVLISSFTTISAALLSPILLFYFSSYIKSGKYLLTIETVKKETDISDTLKNIILDNPDLVDVINHFLLKEVSSQLTSMISLGITACTISYIIGGLLINRKITKNKLKAKSIYRKLIKEEYPMEYKNLVACSYYGGEDYENLLLNNDITSKIIKDNEVKLDIPNYSIKTQFTAWLKRKIIVYSIFSSYKKIFSELRK